MYEIEVLLSISLEDANQHIPRSLGVIEETPHGVLLRCNFQRLDWIAHFLAGLGYPIHMLKPVELRQALGDLAERVRLIAITNSPSEG